MDRSLCLVLEDYYCCCDCCKSCVVDINKLFLSNSCNSDYSKKLIDCIKDHDSSQHHYYLAKAFVKDEEGRAIGGLELYLCVKYGKVYDEKYKTHEDVTTIFNFTTQQYEQKELKIYLPWTKEITDKVIITIINIINQDNNYSHVLNSVLESLYPRMFDHDDCT